MSASLEEYPNRHKGKLCAIVTQDTHFKLEDAKWKKGMTFVDECAGTAPVGTIMYVAAYTFGWAERQGPTTRKQYALARVTRSERMRDATRGYMAWFKTTFVLINDGWEHA